jgi:hypothetical protein
MNDRRPLELRAVRIELKNSSNAMKRLLPSYVESLRASQVSDDVIGEVSTVVRALRSALDKLANALHLYLYGSESHGYFPLVDAGSDFDSALRKALGEVTKLDVPLAEAIRSCQPFVPEYAALGKLRGLYRVNTHRGYELHEANGSVIFSETDSRKQEIREWPGVHLDHKTYDVFGAARGTLYVTQRSDWYFAETAESVYGLLLELHNLVVKAIGRVTVDIATADESAQFASLALYLSREGAPPIEAS